MGSDHEPAKAATIEGSTDVVKPSNDKLEYRFLQPSNKLQVIVISDAETDKAAAAMDVRVGSFSDPDNIAGLAHFTEHMLFYASEKYPKEDEYNKFVSEHGGSTNAFTASEHTNYHFHVNWDHLPEALDRFAQFFLCPLISAEGVDREIQAVDSEHSKNINSDAWRNMQLWKHLANKQHPFHKFATGNLATLQDTPRSAGVDVHSAMKEFYTNQYSANLMRLVVYGRENLDTLEEMVTSKFSGVANADLQPLNVTADVFGGQEGFLTKMVPVGESSILEMSWVVPPEYKSYRYSPCHYLSHLLGHEGPGSCFQLLKTKKWVTSLSAGESGLSISSASFFGVRVELTDEGHENVFGVLGVIFQYICLLKSSGVSKQIFDEMKALAEMNFNFRDKQNPMSVVTNMAAAMQMYPTEHTLLGMYSVPMEFSPAAIHEVLDCITPEQVRIMWSSKRHTGEVKDVEPIYSTQYEASTIPREQVIAWGTTEPSKELFVPEPNPFVPTDFSIIEPAAQEAPEVVSKDTYHKLWYMPDKVFKTPKAYMYMEIVCAEAYATPEHAVQTRLLVKLVNDYLNPLAYPAELAGLHYSLNNTATGFQLAVYGYNHKLPVLLSKVLDHLVDFKVKEERFLVCKEQLMREYANMRYEQPYQRGMYQTSVLCEARRWHIDEYQSVIGDLAAEDLSHHFKRMMARTFTEVLVMGNISREGSQLLLKEVRSAQQRMGSRALFESQRFPSRIVQIPAGSPVLCSQEGPNPENDNSSIVITFQVEANNMRATCLAQLLAQLGKPAAFHQLRTVEQLGYIVFMVSQSDFTVINLRFILQSSSYTVQHMEDRVHKFLPVLDATLTSLTQDEFEKQVEELVKSKLEKPKRLSMEAGRIWREISAGTCIFDRPQQEVDILRSLTLDDLRAFFNTYILDVTHRKLLSVHIRGKNSAEVSSASEATTAATTDTAATNNSSSDPQFEAPPWGVVAGKVPGSAETMEGSAAVARPLIRITDTWAYKRMQALYPSPK